MTGRHVAPIEFVLFDLGGVLMEVDGVRHMQNLSGLPTEEAVWERWLTCDWVREFERGRCEVDVFAAGVVGHWSLTITPEEFAVGFGQWVTGTFAGARELAAEVRATTPIGCLSNSNALHWEVQETWGMDTWFDHMFLSHEMGLIKPDPEVFDHVASALGLAPGQILFLDDNALNVDAAVARGYNARVVRGVTEAKSVLVEVGVLLP